MNFLIFQNFLDFILFFRIYLIWYSDTGATNQMTGCREFFSDLDSSTTGFVKFGHNSRIQIKGKGVIEVS